MVAVCVVGPAIVRQTAIALATMSLRQFVARHPKHIVLWKPTRLSRSAAQAADAKVGLAGGSQTVNAQGGGT